MRPTIQQRIGTYRQGDGLDEGRAQEPRHQPRDGCAHEDGGEGGRDEPGGLRALGGAGATTPGVAECLPGRLPAERRREQELVARAASSRPCPRGLCAASVGRWGDGLDDEGR